MHSIAYCLVGQWTSLLHTHLSQQAHNIVDRTVPAAMEKEVNVGKVSPLVQDQTYSISSRKILRKATQPHTHVPMTRQSSSIWVS